SMAITPVHTPAIAAAAATAAFTSMRQGYARLTLRRQASVGDHGDSSPRVHCQDGGGSLRPGVVGSEGRQGGRTEAPQALGGRLDVVDKEAGGGSAGHRWAHDGAHGLRTQLSRET